MTIQKNWLQELETRAAAGDRLAHRILGLYWAGLVSVETRNGVRWLIPASPTALFFWHQRMRPWAVDISFDGETCELKHGLLNATKEAQWIEKRMSQSIDLITRCTTGLDDFLVNKNFFHGWGKRLISKGPKIINWIHPVSQEAWDINLAIDHLRQGTEPTLPEGYALLAVLALDAHRHDVAREALSRVLEIPAAPWSCEGLDWWSELARQFIPRIAYVGNHSNSSHDYVMHVSHDALESAKKSLATSDIYLSAHEMLLKYSDLPNLLLNKSHESGYAEGAFF